jgi:hypothetical protein
VRTLLVGGHVYSSAERFATAMLLDGRTVAWIGTDAGAQVHMSDVDEVVTLNGDLVAPGFVHVSDPNPDADGGFVHGERAEVRVADRWVAQAWVNSATEPLAVVPRDPCRLRSRIAGGVPTCLVPAHDESGWQTVRAAVHEVDAREALSARAAFSALTRSPWRMLGHPDRGILEVGCAATFVQWTATDLVVETPDERITNWSTDPRAATPGLPSLLADLPEVRRIWQQGRPDR